jgi:hypothetical protein
MSTGQEYDVSYYYTINLAFTSCLFSVKVKKVGENL